MKFLNDLVEDLLKRSEVNIGEATFTIALETNKILINGSIPVKVVDIEKPANRKVLANLTVPVKAEVAVDEVTFPVPTLQ